MSSAENLFTLHGRLWKDNRFVYPVISRRSKGLSIGINLNPDKACNFDCVYCSVDRSIPGDAGGIDLPVLRRELDQMLSLVSDGSIWTITPFDRTVTSLRRLNDIAFSGDGEPTACKSFGRVCELAVEVLAGLPVLRGTKIVVITNATLLHRPGVTEALTFLDSHRGEIWAKLDAGTEEYYQTIERTKVPFQQVLANILTAGRSRPIVIQSLILKLAGAGPAPAEIDAYLNRLRELITGGCQIKLVQIYTVARPPAESSVTPLEPDAIDQITSRVRDLGLSAEGFYGPT